MLENKHTIIKYYLLVFGLNIIYSIQFSPLFDALGYDNEIFQYIGMLITKGGIPYKDVFDHKPPVIYLVNALCYKIYPGSEWPVFSFYLFLNIFSSLMIFKRAIQLKGSYKIAIFLTLIFIVLMNNFRIIGTYNLTRQLTVHEFVFFLYFYTSQLKFKSKFVLFGILSVLIFFTQQNEVLCLFPFIGYQLLSDTKNIYKNFNFLILGSICLFVGFLSLFLFWHNLSEFISQNFLFNIGRYISKEPFYTHVFIIFKLIFRLSIRVWAIPILLGLFGLIVLKTKFKKITIVFLISLLLELLSCSLSGRPYAHYLLMFIPIFLFYFILEESNNNFIKIVLPFYVYIVIFSFVVDSYKHYKIWKNYDVPIIQIIDDLKSDKLKISNTNKLYSFDASFLRLNYELGYLAPSNIVYSHFNDTSTNKQLLNDLLLNKPTFILQKDSNFISDKKILNFLSSNYDRTNAFQDIKNYKHLQLYIIKDSIIENSNH